MMSGRRRVVASATLALAIGVAVFAFAATNTVPATNAGAGSNTISGYTVTSVHYTLGTTPTDLDAVDFTIAPTNAATVKVQIVDGGTWYDCTNTAGSVTCDTTSPQATVAPTDQLSVVAAQ